MVIYDDSPQKLMTLLVYGKRQQKHLLLFDYLREARVAQTVKKPPAMQETWVQSLGREDPLEKEMATHSSILT